MVAQSSGTGSDDPAHAVPASDGIEAALHAFASEGVIRESEAEASSDIFEIRRDDSFRDWTAAVSTAREMEAARSSLRGNAVRTRRVVRLLVYVTTAALAALGFWAIGRSLLAPAAVELPQPRIPQRPLAAVLEVAPFNPPPAAPTQETNPPTSPPVVKTTPVTPAARDAIGAVVNRYLSALSALDVEATRAVWPSVNLTALRRDFAGLDTQELELNDCEVAVAGGRATARCNGVARYLPKAGSKTMFVRRREWHFALVNARDRWYIETVEVH